MKGDVVQMLILVTALHIYMLLFCGQPQVQPILSRARQHRLSVDDFTLSNSVPGQRQSCADALVLC